MFHEIADRARRVSKGSSLAPMTEFLVARELWIDHKKLIFFPFSSAATCTNHLLGVELRSQSETIEFDFMKVRVIGINRSYFDFDFLGVGKNNADTSTLRSRSADCDFSKVFINRIEFKEVFGRQTVAFLSNEIDISQQYLGCMEERGKLVLKGETWHFMDFKECFNRQEFLEQVHMVF
ncbi:hypothetical protein Taro_022010 [Colocasia esculenta]|uniref:Uncharacterized protein n=1 Tax=Colocasia esculenta TaxID=4460 RepID=A0A843V751_COLES|nr:hypothetical protein [Colocasia esculenta]